MKLEELKKIRLEAPHETLFPETTKTLESWDCSAFILAHLLDEPGIEQIEQEEE